MTEFGCSLDLKKSLMKVRDIEINMWHESSGKPKTCIRCQDKIIPAHSECVVDVFVSKRDSEGPLNMIEGTKLFQQKYNIVVARTLNDVCTSKTVVRLCNPTQEDIRLKKDINVSICQSVTFCVAESTRTLISIRYPLVKVKCKVTYKIENFNYLNVAFKSYKLTMWDSLLFSDGHKASRPTSKKKRHLCLAVASSCHHVITSDQSSYFLVEIL